MLVEQAVFSSADTDLAQGYQIVARSPGVLEQEAQELTTWCPSHDALLDEGPNATSVNFHRLSTGSYCVSRTIPSGAEYSDRGAVCLTTHCLILPPELLARFANNPFAVMQAVVASGRMDRTGTDSLSKDLPAFPLLGRAAAFDRSLVLRMSGQLGTERFSTLIDAVLTADSLGVSLEPLEEACGRVRAEQLIEALLNCFPVECRSEFSFSTGLKHSSRRGYRWLVLGSDPLENKRLERQFGTKVVPSLEGSYQDDPAGSETPLPQEVWTAYVLECLRGRCLTELAAQFAVPRPGLKIEELAEVGGRLLEDIGADEESSEAQARTVRIHTQAHAPHTLESGCQEETPLPKRLVGPSCSLDVGSSAAVAKLERLDETVYSSIAGDMLALERLKSLWAEALSQLAEELVEVSRTEYLQFALNVWNDFINDGDGGPRRAAAALEVICLLSEE